ncbi:hypothetical protein MWU75_13380 [Ornithinimicrobium sp. F0845]|uniref:hypothetical protein n=1 Tax=Ornithinimicrobium sp. F0845 TaxID=2926412 RepID=UPI001FF570AE|nr:hypothetical protein [Ornithinimicrobium sp. F0845]MCK0113136.1 hypothetical protein [Ornithinimicrobium sp. F0845]
MLILGLALVIVALVVFGYLFFGTSDLEPLQIDLGVFTVELTSLQLYLLGAATLVVLVLGLLLATMGLRASRRRQREVKELRKAVEERPPRDASPVERDRAPHDTDRASHDTDRAPYDREVPPPPAPASSDVRSGSGSPTTAPRGSSTVDEDHSSIDLPSDHRSDDPPGGARRA